MGTLGVLVLWMTGIVACVSAESNFFFVVAPNMIRFEHPETVMISVFGRQRTVRIWLSHNGHKFSEHTAATVRQDTPHQTTIMVRERDLVLDEHDQKPRTIRLTAEVDGVQKHEDILMKYSSGYIYVQTSQPIYKPNDLVKIRYLALTETMQNVNNNVNVTMDVISPEGHVFARQHKTKADTFHTYDFKLPPNTEIGIWTVKVYFRGMYQTESRALFEVREYIVPTFGVDINVDTSTILPNSDRTIHVEVTSKYVYGKPVKGRCDLKVYLSENNEQTELMAKPMTKLNAQGMVDFTIDLGKINRTLKQNHKWFPNGQRLKLIATTSEGATLNRESGIHTGIVFSEKPYIFKFTRSKRYFRYLRNYFLRTDVQHPNGAPAAGVEVRSWQVVGGQRIPCDECEGETDEKGQITFIFPYSEDSRIVLQVDDMEGQSTSERFVVEKYKGGTNQIAAEYIIRDGEHQITADNNMQDSATGLTSMLISRGEIIDTDFERKNNEPVKILTNSLQEKLSPSGRYVVFYVDTSTNEVVADSIKVSVTPRCKGQDIHLQADKPYIEPGVSSGLKVTGQRGTHVGISVLDKAMLLLNDKHILHKNKMFEELESHDMGCGHGGGRNSANVFRNAGLTVITNANMNSETRDSVSCEGRRRRRKRDTECEVDQRCCDEGEQFAISLYDDEDVRKGRKYVDKIDCYSKVRQLLLEFPKLPFKCLVAYYHSCFEYVEYRNDEDGLVTKSGDSDYEVDLREINFNEKDIYVRKNFRESFHWADYVLGAGTGEVNIDLKYPDSITEWMIQAIGLTPNNGVCISEPLNVTAYRDFFLQLNLPYQAVRMEHIDVDVTVFMYGESGANSTVSLYMDGVDGLCSNVRPGKKSKKVEFEMQPNSAHNVKYPIIPMEAKKYPIKVTAIAKKLGKGNTDAIQKELYVVNEGAEKLIEFASCLDPMHQLQNCPTTGKEVRVSYSGGETPMQSIVFDLTPGEHLKDTASATAFIYSDNAMEDVVQAVLIGGVATWIQLPQGCVEQTVSKLAPLVYAMNYLKLTKQVTEKIEMDGNKYIRSGVLRQYGFKKGDHSYPPYARSGTSTWLTAFIAKVFCQAKKVVDDSVDESVHVSPTINWLATHQNGDGSFTEHNRVNHGSLMGLSQVGSPALTAFILIALQECNTRSTNVERAIKKAMSFLERQDINILRTDPYALAITSYALAISNSTKKMTTYEHLKEIAGRSEGMMYWRWSRTGPVQPADTEATSYALLASLQLDDLRSSNETVNWLKRHRTSGGAFQSTQDTVIGLQALSEYNIRTYRTDVDLTVKLMGEGFEKVFRVNKDNALVQKVANDLPTGDDLRVEVTGKGTGNMRIDLRYNVEKTDAETCPFDIEVSSKLIKLNKTEIMIGKLSECECGVCEETDEGQGAKVIDIAFGGTEMLEIDTNFGRKKRNAQGGPQTPKQYCTAVEVNSLIDTVGMVTVEIGLQTGMTVLKTDLDSLKGEEKISMYELPASGKGFFVLYIDKMHKDQNYRFAFTLEDTTGEDVYNRQASYVIVTDYYNPDSNCRASYGTGSDTEPTYSVECNDDACKCLDNTCPDPWKEKLKKMYDDKRVGRIKIGPADFLVRRTCDRHYAEYAVLVEILARGDGNVEQKYSEVTAQVIKVFNQGKERQRPGMQMHFLWRMDCKWPKLHVGKKYYIIARDGISYTDEAGGNKFKYYIREGDIVLQWKPVHTPIGKFMIRGYERYWETKQCPK